MKSSFTLLALLSVASSVSVEQETGWDFKLIDGDIANFQVQRFEEEGVESCTPFCSLNNGSLNIVSCNKSDYPCPEKNYTYGIFCPLLDAYCRQVSDTTATTETTTTAPAAIPTENISTSEADGTIATTPITEKCTSEPTVAVGSVTATLLVLLSVVITGWMGTFIWQKRRLTALRKK